MSISSKALGDAGETYACHLLATHGFQATKLHVNAKTYDVEARQGSRVFLISVKVAREKQHVRLGSRRSVTALDDGNFVFAFMPVGKEPIEDFQTSPHKLLILPASVAREDSLCVHDSYWMAKARDPNIFSVMVKGYGSHHKSMWPRWLEYQDAWHLLH